MRIRTPRVTGFNPENNVLNLEVMWVVAFLVNAGVFSSKSIVKDYRDKVLKL